MPFYYYREHESILLALNSRKNAAVEISAARDFFTDETDAGFRKKVIALRPDIAVYLNVVFV